jgi:hypothetical protein
MVPVAVRDPAKPTNVLAAKPTLRRFNPNEIRVCRRFIIGILGVVPAAVLVDYAGQGNLVRLAVGKVDDPFRLW